MKAAIIDSQVTLALLAAGILLLLIIGVELYSAGAAGHNIEEMATAADAPLPAPAQSAYVPPPIDIFSEILERPLFFVNRRLPPVVERTTAPPVPLVPLRLSLEGVAITGDSRVAVLRNLANNQLLQLAEGMTHDGWLLTSVSPEGALFQRGQEVSELRLSNRK